MTTDPVVQLIPDVGMDNDRYRLLNSEWRGVAGLEIRHATTIEKKRDVLWDIYQEAVGSLYPNAGHLLFHGARIDNKNLLQLKKLERNFWPEVLGRPLAELLTVSRIDPRQAHSSMAMFEGGRIAYGAPLRMFDRTLASDRFFLVTTMAGREEDIVNEICAEGWRTDVSPLMQVPDAILRCIQRTVEIICPVPLGRFDDLDRSLICLGGVQVLTSLQSEVNGLLSKRRM